MKMSSASLVIVGGMVITAFFCGCASDNLAKFYQPYTGMQTNWPTNPKGGFVTIENGMTIYHGLPPTPYVLIGRYGRANLPLKRLADSAKYHHAHAVFIIEQSYESLETDPTVMLFAGPVGVALPTQTRKVARVKSFAFLIETNIISEQQAK